MHNKYTRPHPPKQQTGFSNGAVRVLSFPDDVLRVRLYRHEGQTSEGVWKLDSAYAPGKGSLVGSVGMDGRGSLLLLDEMDLMPQRRREQASRLFTVLALQGRDDAGTPTPAQEGEEEEPGGDARRRLACDLGWRGTALLPEQFDASPKGDITVPLRASLTAVRVVSMEAAAAGGGGGGCGGKTKAMVGVGSFAGLCRVLALR